MQFFCQILLALPARRSANRHDESVVVTEIRRLVSWMGDLLSMIVFNRPIAFVNVVALRSIDFFYSVLIEGVETLIPTCKPIFLRCMNDAKQP